MADSNFLSRSLAADLSPGTSVLVAMSGGVDSSVAAALLKEAGFNVIGAHLICWDGCDLKQEKHDALRVAAALNIPFLSFDFRADYRARVFDPMIRDYAAGQTPNPDVLCNREIKFGLLLEKARDLGVEYIATGHYARLGRRQFRPVLSEASDKSKDQSYFLWAVENAHLNRCVFPLGDYSKAQVREMARQRGLPTAEKKDSQGLCFVGNVNFGYFLRDHLPGRQGIIVNARGEVLGKHDGVAFYTIGQRHGLGIGGGAPYYVADKNVETNTLFVGKGAEDPALFKAEVSVHQLNWHSEFRAGNCAVRIRYRQPKVAAVLESRPGGLGLRFAAPQRGVAAGQSAVFYDGERILGGGVIG
jgi:tRNA-specific 2-thiouridylase